MLRLIRIVILSALLLHVAYCEFKPLQVGDAPVSMYYQYNDIYLDYALSRQLSANVLFCFVKARKVTASFKTQTDGSLFAKLSLEDTALTFFCVHLFQDANLDFTKQFSEKNIDITKIWLAEKVATSTVAKTNTNQYYQPLNPNATVTIQSQLLSQILVISNYFQEKSIYHMITCPQWSGSISTGTCNVQWKQNYAHTFKHPEKKMNLITQRIHYGGVYIRDGQNITSHAFFGGAIRNGKNYLFVAMLTYLADPTHKLNMWGGFSYSCNHANHDLFCYDTDGNSFDGVSLLLGPVYKDISPNIGGNDDDEIVDSFYSERYTNYYMYFIQYHRPYQTSSDLGDENVMKKIYGKFCYVAHFQLVSPSQSIIIPPSCLSSSYMHNFQLSFRSDLSLFQPLITVVVCFLLLLAFL